VPHFAGRYRTVRVDVRGFGRSTPMLDTFQWHMDILVEDIAALIRELGVEPVHVVGAKSGGSMTLMLAADHPQLVKTLIGVTPPVVGPAGAHEWRRIIPEIGMEEWARRTMLGRLGSRVSQAEMNWWVETI